MDTPSKIKLGGTKLKIFQAVQDTINNKPSPKINTFWSNNNNLPSLNLIYSRDMSNKFNILMVDINNPRINIFDLVYTNHSRFWQL